MSHIDDRDKMADQVNGQQQTALASGLSLGQYEIGAVRGCNEVGIEYSAHDREAGTAVVIREFLPGLISIRKGDCAVEPIHPQNAAQFDSFLEAFLAEARALSQCDAPGINAIRDVFRANGTGYVVAESPFGNSLDEILEREGTIGGEALSIMLPTLLDSLGKLHEAGLLHLDIRPDNIMLQETGSATLRGFGAVPVNLGSARRSFGGTRWKRQVVSVQSAYSPIELYSEKTLPGPWSDIYSLGAVLYHCVTGSTPPPVTDRVLEDSMVWPASSSASGIDSKLLSASKEATAIVPTARPRNVAALRARLFGESPARPRAQFARAAARGGRLTPNANSVKRAGNFNAQGGARKWAAPALALAGATALVAFIDVGVLRLEQDAADTEPSLVHLAMAGRTEAVTYNLTSPDAAAGQPGLGPAGEPLAVAGAGAILVVETVPSNVEVLVAGRAVGYTPLHLPGLPDGIHDITLRHKHYETVEFAGQQFVAAEELRIETTMKRGLGNLLITTDPPGAWVEINDDRVLETTPGTLRELPAGPVEIELGAPGHTITRVTAEVPRGGTGYLARILPIAYGTLEVDIEPTDAQVVVSNDTGIAYRYNPGMRLPEGSYRVEVTKQGYREVARTVSIDGETNIRIELRPQS